MNWKCPPASHVVAPTQDTPLRAVKAVGPGGACSVHEVPFHTAPMLGLSPEVSLYWPTASQNFAVAQETPVKPADVALGGLGIVWALQDDPFHTSPPPEPTVSQKAADMQETELAPAIPGRACRRQASPFQRSAKDPAPSELPTASQNVAEGHDTPLSLANVTPAGLGTGWRRQETPFHLAAKGRFSPTLLS